MLITRAELKLCQKNKDQLPINGYTRCKISRTFSTTETKLVTVNPISGPNSFMAPIKLSREKLFPTKQALKRSPNTNG